MTRNFQRRRPLPKARPARQYPHYRDERGRTYRDRENELLEFFVEFTVAHRGHTPTLRHCCDALGVNSTSVLNGYITNLVAQGKLMYEDGYLVLPGSKLVIEEVEQGDRAITVRGQRNKPGDGGITPQQA